MKIKGQAVNAKNLEYIVIPRQQGDIVFVAQAVMSYDEFETMCPRPQPPKRTHKGGSVTLATDDPKYLKLLNDWAQQHSDWMVLRSLEATEGLTWDKVDMAKPETYQNWRAELTEAGFVNAEIMRILSGVMTANGLNQVRIDEAQSAFLAGLAKGQNLALLPLTEPLSTPSGEPAKDSE